MASTPDDPLQPPSADRLEPPLPLAPLADLLVPPAFSSPPAPMSPPLADPLGPPPGPQADALPFDAGSDAADRLPSPPGSEAAEALPLAPEPATGPTPPPVSFAPDSVRQRDAADLPFALSPGGFGSPSPMGDATPTFDDHEGIPTGLPDLRKVAGLEQTPAPAERSPALAAPEPPVNPTSAVDDDLMALPSPSMMEPSPFADDDESEEDELPSLPDAFEEDVVVGHRPASLHDDVTQEDQLPPTPIGMVRRDGPNVVPARIMLEALEASERRHIVHLAIAFSLGAASSVLGFVAARWAMAL